MPVLRRVSCRSAQANVGRVQQRKERIEPTTAYWKATAVNIAKLRWLIRSSGIHRDWDRRPSHSGNCGKLQYASDSVGSLTVQGSFQGWTLLDALERTADPALWDAYAAAKSEWERGRTPIPSGPTSFVHTAPEKIASARRGVVELHETIRSNFRELLLQERLIAYGSRNGPSEMPSPLRAAGWRNLAWPKLKNSTLKERVGAKTKIFNVRVFPILHSDRAPSLLNGLSLADAFRKYVLEDPEVVALGKRVVASCGYRDIFEKGQAPGPFVDFHWSLGLSASELASEFIRPLAFWDSSKPPKPPPEILRASTALADRCQALQRLLVSGQVTAIGTFAQSGVAGPIHRMQWQRSGVTVEIRNGDFCEAENHRPVVRWSGIMLELPHHQRGSVMPIVDLPAVEADDPPAPLPVNTEERKQTSAGQESIGEAIRALWPNGIPRGLQVQKRDDQIIDWQRKNNRTVVGPRSIRRYLSRSPSPQ